MFRSGSSITFAGSNLGGILGFYRWTASGINPIVTTSTPIPNGTGNFTTWGFQSLSGDRFVISGGNATRRGLYSRNASGVGPVSVIVDNDTPVPGLPGQTFAGASYVSTDGANTAFTGGSQTIGGVYAHLNNQLLRIADYLTPGPNGQVFTQFSDVSMSGDSVAFLARTALSEEILVWRNGALTRVVKTGDVLNGLQVQSLSLTSQSLRGDTVAFTFNKAPGGPQDPIWGGVYTATYIPAPGASLLLAFGLIATRRHRH